MPSLEVFDVFLGEHSGLEEDLKLYQKLLAHDQDGAYSIVEKALEGKPKLAIYDEFLVPTLARAKRDRERELISTRDHHFIAKFTSEFVDEHDGGIEQSVGERAEDRITVAGLGVAGAFDEIALEMLRKPLEEAGVELKILGHERSPLVLADKLAELSPKMLIVSCVPPTSLVRTRYLIRRLKARTPALPVVVGYWIGWSGKTGAIDSFKDLPSQYCVASLVEAVERIKSSLTPGPEIQGPARPSRPLPQPAEV